MKVLVNGKVLQYGFSGVQRYLSEILAYGVRHNINYELLEHGYKGAKSYLYEQTILNFKHSEAILWSPSNVGPAFRKNQIITIHDAVPFDHPEWLEADFVKIFKAFAPISYKSAKSLICISEFTKSRIVSIFPSLEEKITVIHNGVSSKFFSNDASVNDGSMPEKYILALSAIEPRKNISSLTRAWIESLNYIPDDIYLVIAGEKARAAIFKDVDLDEESLKRCRIIFTGFIPEDKIVALYKHALFFVYPSFYEGFGLPVLEAMATGLPVVTSNTSSLREIATKGSLLIDPYDYQSIGKAIIEMSNNDFLRKELAFEAIQHASNFTWEKCSDKTWQIIQDGVYANSKS